MDQRVINLGVIDPPTIGYIYAAAIDDAELQYQILVKTKSRNVTVTGDETLGPTFTVGDILKKAITERCRLTEISFPLKVTNLTLDINGSSLKVEGSVKKIVFAGLGFEQRFGEGFRISYTLDPLEFKPTFQEGGKKTPADVIKIGIEVFEVGDQNTNLGLPTLSFRILRDGDDPSVELGATIPKPRRINEIEFGVVRN